jgi:hypothetical protein
MTKTWLDVGKLAGTGGTGTMGGLVDDPSGGSELPDLEAELPLEPQAQRMRSEAIST